MDRLFIRREYPPEQAQEEEEKDDERDDGPNGDVINILKNVLVHVSKVKVNWTLSFRL
jgi:hypothetical protein